MSWQCKRDGGLNEGGICKICGYPPYTAYPSLMGNSLVFNVNARQRIIGASDWPAVCSVMGVDRFHARIFFDLKEGYWCISNVSNSGCLILNSTALNQSQRVKLNDGDVLFIGENNRFQVKMIHLG